MEDRWAFLLVGFLFFWTSSLQVFAEHSDSNFVEYPDQGVPFIRNYSPKEYKAHSQNCAIVQAPDGRMIFGNGNAVLVYDNEHWVLIPLPNYDHVRLLAVAQQAPCMWAVTANWDIYS